MKRDRRDNNEQRQDYERCRGIFSKGRKDKLNKYGMRGRKVERTRMRGVTKNRDKIKGYAK